MRRIKNLVLSLALITSSLTLPLFTPTFVSAQYDCGSYGYSTYGNQENCDGSDLSNTGEALYIIIPAILVVVGSAGLYKLSRKPKTKKDNQKQP